MVKALVEHIVKRLVDKPDAVIVSDVESEGKHILQIHVAAQDLAKVIGSEGRTFRALRSVVSLVGAQDHIKDIVVDIAE